MYDKQSEKMIPSLRYLCLEKVIAKVEDYADLPEILVKDINIMKVFNGTYVWGGSWGSWDVTVKMKIFYDGKVWSIKIRTWYHDSEGVGEDGKAVCFCKYCWDTTGSYSVDITVKEGEVTEGESDLLDLLGIEVEDNMKVSGWKLKVDLQSDYDRHRRLVKDFGYPKSLGAIEFYGVGEGESTVSGGFQVEVVSVSEKEDCDGQIRAEEWTFLHFKVPGSVNDSMLFQKDDGDEEMHVSRWRDPVSGETRRGVSSFDKIE